MTTTVVRRRGSLLDLRLSLYLLQVSAVAAVGVALTAVYLVRWMVDGPSTPTAPPSFDALLADELEHLHAHGTLPGGSPSRLPETDVPLLVWWRPHFSRSSGVRTCGPAGRQQRCRFVRRRDAWRHPRTAAVFFYGTDLDPLDLPWPRPTGQDWALLHEESPRNNLFFHHSHEIVRLFNHTATFRRQSDLPLTLQYLDSLESLADGTYVQTMRDKRAWQQRQQQQQQPLAPIAYIQSNCDTPLRRDDFVRDLMRHIKVDSYGKCVNNRDLPLGVDSPEQFKSESFLRFLSRYKFVLSLENAICPDYVTEKLWRALQVGVVPVYLGAPNVRDYLPHDRAAVLVQDFNSTEALANHLHFLDENDDEYMKHLRHKSTGWKPELTNPELLRLMKERTWGVSEKDQLSRGNFVQEFECLVCERVAQSWSLRQRGFKGAGLPYQASESHYGCPRPQAALDLMLGADRTSENDTSHAEVDNWNLEFVRTRLVSQAVRYFMERRRNSNYSKEEVREKAVELADADRSLSERERRFAKLLLSNL